MEGLVWPLRPLLSNTLLDELDKELERWAMNSSVERSWLLPAASDCAKRFRVGPGLVTLCSHVADRRWLERAA
jgi:hypothetical protein